MSKPSPTALRRRQGRTNYMRSRADRGVAAARRRDARRVINNAAPGSRAQLISRDGWASAYPDPPATGYKIHFDHAGARRSQHQ